MKIKRSLAVAFFVAIGFGKAATWDNDKLVANLKKVPKLKEEPEVPKEFEELYDQLTNADGKIELDADVEPKLAITEDKEPRKTTKSEKAIDKAAKKGKGKPAPAAKGKKEAKPKAEAKPKVERKVDAYGATVGTIRAKINAQVDGNWQSDDEIATGAEVKPRQARSRLRKMVKAGHFERRRRVEYRLVTKKGSKE